MKFITKNGKKIPIGKSRNAQRYSQLSISGREHMTKAGLINRYGKDKNLQGVDFFTKYENQPKFVQHGFQLGLKRISRWEKTEKGDKKNA